MSESKNTAGYTFATILFLFLAVILAGNGLRIAYSTSDALVASPSAIVTVLRGIAWIGAGGVFAAAGTATATLGLLR